MAGVILEFGADREEYATLVGQTVDSGVIAARQLLDVPTESSSRLNGSEVGSSGSAILKAGDVISFYKASGTKGTN